MPGLDQIVDKLCEASRAAYYSPYGEISWPDALPEDAWYFSPELVSLAGTETYATLEERQRQRLSFFEAVNFFSLNVHGERALLEGLAHRLYRRGDESWTAYLHHFLDEENKHMVYFGTFCTRYAGAVYPDCKLAFPREFAPGEEDFLFFAKVLVFEEIVDVYNKRMAADARLHPLAREINRRHHQDESRHLAFGRRLVRELFERGARGWTPETLRGIRDYLGDYVRATWREYHSPAAYRDAGLADPYALARDAFEAEPARRRRAEVTATCFKVLTAIGVLEEAPRL
jgi:para-aminobenzoate N-oxygenase AurF